MKSSSTDIERVLVDVRKAYRLLHDYQRLVLDAVNYIGKQLELTYTGGYPKFSGPSPRPGRGNLDFWAWDWLNFVLYEFHFRKEEQNRPTLTFAAVVISDSGYFFSDTETTTKTDVSNFQSPEASKTSIGFLISARGWDAPTFLENKKQMKTFIESGGQLPPEFEQSGVIGKCYDLARLVTQEETDRLIDDLVLSAVTAGIPLKRIDPNR